MVHSLGSRRLVVISNALLALALGSSASAQDELAFEREVGLERSEDDSLAVVFEGFVNGPDGIPAGGAVVVSSAGGKAVTDASGSFRLEAQVPIGAESVQITATGGEGGSLLANKRVAAPAWPGVVQVGSLELALGNACSPAWLPTFGGEPGTNSDIKALAGYDDGNGPALYVGGVFTAAGGVAAGRIARWDGSSWSALGSGMDSDVNALTVYDDGGGPALYAGGQFITAGGVAANRIAKWDGSSWTALGSGMSSNVEALTVYDDGSGPALYAGGNFTTAGGVAANYIAKWDGSSWTTLGSGMSSTVNALTVYDDGDGPALYAGGYFTTAGGEPANKVARWDGSSWTTLGSGLGGAGSPRAETLAVYDDGRGPALYAGGQFLTAGGEPASKIAKWNGSSWSALGSGMDKSVRALAVYDDGGGPALYAGGHFTTAGGVAANRIVKWNGSSWSALGSGMAAYVRALAVYDIGGGPGLYPGGAFTAVSGVGVDRVARWDGSSWTALGSGMNSSVRALTVFDDGGGPALYAGGEFTTAGGVAMNHIGKWDGASWTALGSGLDGASFSPPEALTVYDDGGGPALYAGGHFLVAGGVPANYIAKWDGSSWTALGSGMSDHVEALTVYDDGGGPALYAGGQFITAGGVAANRIAKWDGSSWTALGTGLGGMSDPRAEALTVYDDGGGPALYAGGTFTAAGGLLAKYIAKWDGSSWAAVSGGMIGSVEALTVYDDGVGPALYAGGWFITAGGVAASRIAKWDGSSWTALGSGLGGPSDLRAETLTVYDDGGGPALYAGGYFTTAGGMAANNIAKWDGTTWTALGSGLSYALSLTVYDDGSGPSLYAGGSALDSGDSYLSKWGCTAPTTSTYCTAGTSASGCQALLSASGVASATAPSGFTLSAATVEGQKEGLFFFGTNGRQANPWGNGTSYQCVVPPVSRAGTLSGSGTIGACDGSFAQDLNALWCPSCPKPSKNPGAGALVQAQLWYRDPQSTGNQTTSFSEAIEFPIAP